MRDNMYKNGMKILDRKVIFITPYGRRGGRATIKNELKDKKEDTTHMSTLCIYLVVTRYLHRHRFASVVK